jgi:hypothetical protein
MDPRFATRHAFDSRFWALIWLYILVIVLVGFSPPVQDRFFDEFQEPASIALQLHVWSFGAWMVLLAMQAWFASTGRMERHRMFGNAMLPLAAVMVLSAGIAELQFHQRVIANGGNEAGFTAISGTYLLPFCVLVPMAWIARKDPPAHKRLILMATATICAGAHLRTISIFSPEAFWRSDAYLNHLVFGFGGSMLIIAMGMAYDLYSRGSLHPVYRKVAPALFVLYAVAAWAYGSEGYADIARRVIEAL